jgi:hypothetical protein
MNTLVYELLSGTLAPFESPAGSFNAQVHNELPIPVLVSHVPSSAFTPTPSGIGPWPIAPGASSILGSSDMNGDEVPGYYVVTCASTGSLITVLELSANLGPATPTQPVPVPLTKATLSAPSDIGPIPVPTSSVAAAPIEPQPPTRVPNSTVIVPPDSPRVMVGCGQAANGNAVVREQYWERQSDSICLAGHETKTVSYTVTSGKQQTSSDTITMSASLNSNISGGWGPVSASISASLSASSTSFQQVTVTEQVTSYVSNQITNPHEEPIAYFRWQLIDVITVFDKGTGQPVSSLVQAENPSIVAGPYWVSPTPKPPSKGAAARGTGLFEYK